MTGRRPEPTPGDVGGGPVARECGPVAHAWRLEAALAGGQFAWPAGLGAAGGRGRRSGQHLHIARSEQGVEPLTQFRADTNAHPLAFHVNPTAVGQAEQQLQFAIAGIAPDDFV